MRASRPRDSLHVEVGDDQIFFESLPSRDDLTLVIENHTVPVEDQFILTTDRIGVGEHHPVFSRASRQHLLAHPTLAQMKR